MGIFAIALVQPIACAPYDALTAKSDDPIEDPPSRTTANYPDAEPGSCSAWKFAYCDAIDACSAFETREECELDLGWLQCRDDAPLGACQELIEDALKDEACEELPGECGPGAIADRSIVSQLCEEIHLAYCEHRLICGLEFSFDACLETIARVEPCDSFTSTLPGASDCAQAYTRAECDGKAPEVCIGVLRR